MPQTPAADSAELRAERTRLIKQAMARQILNDDRAVQLVNEQLVLAGYRAISTPYFNQLKNGTRRLREPFVIAIAAGLGIPEAQLRHPFAELFRAA